MPLQPLVEQIDAPRSITFIAQLLTNGKQSCVNSFCTLMGGLENDVPLGVRIKLIKTHIKAVMQPARMQRMLFERKILYLRDSLWTGERKSLPPYENVFMVAVRSKCPEMLLAMGTNKNNDSHLHPSLTCLCVWEAGCCSNLVGPRLDHTNMIVSVWLACLMIAIPSTTTTTTVTECPWRSLDHVFSLSLVRYSDYKILRKFPNVMRALDSSNQNPPIRTKSFQSHLGNTSVMQRGCFCALKGT